MPSAALTSLVTALAEVDNLRDAYPGIRGRLAVARAVGRGAVVLLSGHFERYLRAVNEETATFLNHLGVVRTAIPIDLRLLHSRYPIDDIAQAQWTNRGPALEQFIGTDRWLWQDGVPGATDHERFLIWMKSPDPDNLVRYYRYWGIQNIFAVVTRTDQSRGRLWLAVKELVEKRNNIAHGDFSAQASRGDVRRYMSTVQTFCVRADRILARRLAQLTGAPAPW